MALLRSSWHCGRALNPRSRVLVPFSITHHALRQRPFRRHDAASIHLRATRLNISGAFGFCHLDFYSRVLGHSRTKESSATSTGVNFIPLQPATRTQLPQCAHNRQAQLSLPRLAYRLSLIAIVDSRLLLRASKGQPQIESHLERRACAGSTSAQRIVASAH